MVDQDQLRKSENQSMRKSRVGNRYFKVDAGYDKAVYENTIGNWFRIVGTFIVFYIVVAFFWWACFSHGMRHITSATWLYIGVLLVAWFIILLLIIIGHFSNKNLHKAERLMLEVNEEKKKKREEEEKKQKREEAKMELRRQEIEAKKDSEMTEENASNVSSSAADEGQSDSNESEKSSEEA